VRWGVWGGAVGGPGGRPADSGLGYMILMGRQFARPDIIVLGMLIIGGIGALLSVVLMRLERKIEHWRTKR